ncbi:MAG: PASTA domain-containing protein [Clostridia bacterium]|nr:PASTA domain-containing protein [Clostridia bacterium]
MIITKNKRIKNPKVREIKRKESYNKKSIAILAFFIICFLALIIRIGYIQFVKGKEYKAEAYKQQTSSQTILSKRGVIYDASGKVLARSATVDTISLAPGKVQYEDGTIVENEVLADGFAEIFGLNRDELLEKLNSTTSVTTIAKKVEQETVEKLKQWMIEKKIATGINIDTDSKRYYPYDSLASSVIGFCGDDNQGLEGIESAWDDVLTGTPGRIVTSTNVNKRAISDENEQYIPAENGSDIYLTIDANIQSIAEKYLEQAVIENKASRGGSVIIMKPTTGDILAMANYPTYNLNTPFTINDASLASTWDTLSESEQLENLQKMWRNKSISDGYEPGSTFKLVTSAIGLEENLVETDTAGDFYCSGSYQVGEYDIACWRTGRPHGSLTLRQALKGSCNPALMQLGQRIGATLFYKYLDAFGLFNKTGVKMAGETTGYFHDLENVGPVELATMSFGQRFTITPLQLITTISGIVNDGNLMKPRIVSKVVNTDTGIATEISPTVVRQVVSSETSSEIKDMMGSIVNEPDGTGGHAAVTGYSIGGKSGTSEPSPGKEDDGYVASFIAISPVENPQICVLVILYDPRGASHQGGTVAAPVASQILSEVLPYMGLASSVEEQERNGTVTLPDVTKKTLTEARTILESAGLTVLMKSESDDSSIIVSSQYPRAGTSLLTDSVVCLYTSDESSSVSVEVPDLKGKSLEQAKNSLASLNLNIQFEGNGVVVSQDIVAGTAVQEGTVINVTLKEELIDGQ